MDKRQRSRETSRSPSVIRHHGFLQTSSDSLFPLVQKSWRNLLLTHHNLQLWDLTRGGKSFSLPCSKLSLFPDAWWLISVLQQAASPHKKLQYFPFQLTSHAIPWRYCHTLWREERPTAHSLLHSLWCVYIHSSFQNALLCIHSLDYIAQNLFGWSGIWARHSWGWNLYYRGHIFFWGKRILIQSAQKYPVTINSEETEEEIRGPNPRQGKTSSCDG